MSQSIETSSRKRHRNLSPSTFGIYNELKKVSHGTGTDNRIFRSCDKFDSNDSFSNRRESERNFTGTQNNIFNKRDNGFAVNTISRSPIIHHTSSPSNSDSIWLPTASTSVSSERRMSYKEKIILNDQALGELQWWIENLKYFNGKYLTQDKPQIVIQTDASLEGWGANCMGMETGREMVRRRVEIAYKYPRTHSGEECHLSFYRRENNRCNSYQDRQHNFPLIPSENGRYDRQDACRFKQSHLEISDIEVDHNYWRISTRYSEHKSRWAVSLQQELLRMGVISSSIPTYFPENGDARDRSACFQIIQSNRKMFSLETRPTQFSYGCNATRMEPGNSICISPVFVNSESTLQNSKRESQ